MSTHAADTHLSATETSQTRHTPRSALKSASSKPSSIFTAPEPIRRLFEQVPLITYPANELPRRSRRQKAKHALYIFTTASGVRMDSPSFNPSCLKWQTILKFLDIPFVTVSSSNHASPSGALPYVLPANSSDTIPSSKLDSWLKNQLKEIPSIPVRQQPYLSLVSQNIRLAYLYALYLDDQAFSSVAAPYYIHPSSNNSLVRAAMAPSLRAAALEQLMASQASNSPSPKLDLDRLFKDADDAFDALSTLLGEQDWFTSSSSSGSDQPGMLDASVFAYTHVILTLFSSLEEGSPGERLRASITRRSNLLDHHGRIAKRYYHSPR